MNIPSTNKKRVVVIGGGFAGINLIEKLSDKKFQTVLIDRNNYHQFPPLIYQVASTGLEAASVCFPFRRLFSKKKDFYFRLAEVERVDSEKKVVVTSVGEISYDYLVISAGATTNFFNNPKFMEAGIPMKTVEDAMYLRNRIIENFENATIVEEKDWEPYKNIVIVGGGATGVEIAGAMAEMRKYAFKRNFKELKGFRIKIYLVSSNVLGSMSEKASRFAERSLQKMGVTLVLNTKVVDYENNIVTLSDGKTIPAKTLIWVSGIKAVTIEGVPADSLGRGGRILCDERMCVKGLKDVFAAGDIALTSEKDYPDGHPQMAQVAIQQAGLIARNLNAEAEGQSAQTFHYRNLGAMATIGRNKAVADIGPLHFGGFFAWVIWSFIHLRSILGAKNQLLVLIDWVVNYFCYIASLRSLRFKGKR